MPLAIISVLVDNQDEALQFYTEKLGLEKRTDVTFGPGMRWLTVAPRGQRRPEIALAIPDASLPHIQRSQEIERDSGHWFGYGVSGIFDTVDCTKMYATLLARGVKFVSPPTCNYSCLLYKLRLYRMSFRARAARSPSRIACSTRRGATQSPTR